MAAKKAKTPKAIPPRKTDAHPSAFINWFERHFTSLTILVLCIAALLRVSMLMELPRMPFNQLHKAPDLDMNFFDLWGDRIARGDILTDTVWHPFHFWHKALTDQMGIMDEQAAKEKWNTWYGGKKYHQEPLYPLIIGFAKMIDSDGRTLVFVLQMLLTILSIWMAIWLGKHYFSAFAGISAGLLFTFYGPALLFDATLLRTSISTTLLLGCIVMCELLIKGRHRAWLMGFVGGLSYLLMTTSILLWLPLIVRWLVIRPKDVRQVWKTGLAFAFCLSFLVYRNSVTGSPLMSSSSVGPVTYLLSNFPEYKPELGFAFFGSAGKIMNETNGEMVPTALKIIDKHKSIWSWIWLQFKKLGAVFHWYEIPNNVNSYLAREFSTTLKFTFIPYSIIAALGLMGLFANVRNKKTINLIIGLLSQIAVMVVFYVLCRFRVPMVAMLCVFGGYTLQKLTEFKPYITWAIFFAGSIALGIFVVRPLPEIHANFAEGDLKSAFNLYYLPKLDELSAKNDLNSCIPLVKEFIATMPSFLEDPKQLASLDSGIEKDLAYYYGLVYGDLAGLYEEIGNEAEHKATLALSTALIKASGR